MKTVSLINFILFIINLFINYQYMYKRKILDEKISSDESLIDSSEYSIFMDMNRVITYLTSKSGLFSFYIFYIILFFMCIFSLLFFNNLFISGLMFYKLLFLSILLGNYYYKIDRKILKNYFDKKDYIEIIKLSKLDILFKYIMAATNFLIMSFIYANL